MGTTTWATLSDMPPLRSGSVLARALFEVWNRRRIVNIESPPGAGKTTLLLELVGQLVHRTDLRINVVTPTNNGGLDIVKRLHALLPVSGSGVSAVKPQSHTLKALARTHVPGWVEPLEEDRAVGVSTVASAIMAEPRQCDVLIVDEAFQITYSDLLTAAAGARQIVMVGDSGQIGPVVTVDTSLWDRLVEPPHVSAPFAFRAHPDAVTLHLPSTYRLGPVTTQAIQCLYPTPFISLRTEQHVEVAGGVLPEIVGLQVPVSTDPYAMDVLRVIVERVRDLLAGVVHVAGEPARPVVQGDIAVVVSHVAQRTAIDILLSGAGLTGVKVGTADSLQGGQWPIVVALDPLVGYETATEHSLSTGRLCVMASRHLSHLTWVFDAGWESSIHAAHADEQELAKSLHVRSHLTANSVVASVPEGVV